MSFRSWFYDFMHDTMAYGFDDPMVIRRKGNKFVSGNGIYTFKGNKKEVVGWTRKHNDRMRKDYIKHEDKYWGV